MNNRALVPYGQGQPVQPPDPLTVITFILFWPFMLIGRVLQSMSQQGAALPPAPFQFIKGPEASYDNEETWEWEDWRGRKRSITVKRKARVR
jgi:hypothetical protein